MNQFVGGLRAGARIHELRKEGYTIHTSSDPRSDVDRYMLVVVEAGFVGQQLTAEEIWG